MVDMINFEKRYGELKAAPAQTELPQTLPEAQTEILRLRMEQKVLFDLVEQLMLRIALT